MRGRSATLVARVVGAIGVAALIVSSAAPHDDQSFAAKRNPAKSRSYDFDWVGQGGCTVPVIGMPTSFANVAPYIPRHRYGGMTTVGTEDERRVVLIFVLVSCPTNRLETAQRTFERPSVDQAMVGVLYRSSRREDFEKTQFYLLSSTVNWRPLARAERRIGLNTDFVRSVDLPLARTPVGTGTFAADVPRGRTPFSVEGNLVAPNPIREFPFDSAHFFDGRHGVVRVHHDEVWAFGNAAAGTVTAPAGTLVAEWMGSTQRAAQGIYFWDHHTSHVHRYGLVRRD